MLLPLALQKKLRTAMLLVRARDLLKLARCNVVLFEFEVSVMQNLMKWQYTENEVDEYELTCNELRESAEWDPCPGH